MSKRASTNRLIGGIGILIIAIVLIFTGLSHEQEPTCNNTTMKPGDLCILSTGTAVSYEQRKADTGRVGLIQLVGAGAGIVAGGLLVGRYVRDRRRAATVPPATTT